MYPLLINLKPTDHIWTMYSLGRQSCWRMLVRNWTHCLSHYSSSRRSDRLEWMYVLCSGICRSTCLSLPSLSLPVVHTFGRKRHWVQSWLSFLHHNTSQKSPLPSRGFSEGNTVLSLQLHLCQTVWREKCNEGCKSPTDKFKSLMCCKLGGVNWAWFLCLGISHTFTRATTHYY